LHFPRFHSRKKHFAEQLLQCLDDSTHTKIISWSADGQSVVIHDWGTFCTDLIPRHFPNKLISTHQEEDKVKKRKATFLKQTNNYGFTAVHDIESNSCTFSRPDFQREHRVIALNIDPRVRPPPPIKGKTPLMQLSGINGSHVSSPTSYSGSTSSLKRARPTEQTSSANAASSSSTADGPPNRQQDGPGRRRCNHAEKSNIKNSRGITSATCLSKCGSTIRQCSLCSEWENHNNFYRHAVRCPAATVHDQENQSTKSSVSTMTTTRKTTVVETTVTVTTTTTITSTSATKEPPESTMKQGIQLRLGP